MNGLFKKLVVGVTSLTMAASMGTAFAQTEMSNMVFAGYDTTDPLNPNKVYNEVVGGKYTNKQVLEPIAPEWVVEGYEGVYPYAGYSRMYLEGKRQDITVYNQLSPQWETRRKDYMWEMAYPYTIYERQQTKVDNKTWQWDFGNPNFNIPDAALLNSTHREAVVLNTEWKNYGFGRYTSDGTRLTDEQIAMYSRFNVYTAVSEWDKALAGILSVDSLSDLDENNRYKVSDVDIANAIYAVDSKYITAKFNPTGNDGLSTKNAAAEYLVYGDTWRWDNDSLITENGKVTISWTAPDFEMAEPYKYYQYLIVNGVVMNGKNGKDEILRYTGGKASPKITWKFAFFQNALDEYGQIIEGVYEVVERKYVDGVPAVDAHDNPIYRIPTGEYGNTYFVVKDKTIEYWVIDAAGNKTLLNVFDKFSGRIDGTVDDGVYDANDLADAYTNGIIYYTQAY